MSDYWWLEIASSLLATVYRFLIPHLLLFGMRGYIIGVWLGPCVDTLVRLVEVAVARNMVVVDRSLGLVALEEVLGEDILLPMGLVALVEGTQVIPVVVVDRLFGLVVVEDM